MKIEKKTMLLYGITDRTWLGENTLEEQVEKALKGGITILQLREKNLPKAEFLQEAVKIRELTKKYKVPFIINDNVEIAASVDADGVHLGQKDIDILEARKKLGEKKIIGISAKTVEQAVLAQKKGADYLGVGAVFSTSTKKDTILITKETLKQICETVSIPVVAIGGIQKDNLMQLKGSKIAGIAVVSAIFASKDIEAETKELYTLSKRLVEK